MMAERCPCCGSKTLSQRSAYEICPTCSWEDDGQDDATADEIWGGPNGKLSLSAARRNFQSSGGVDAGTPTSFDETDRNVQLLELVRAQIEEEARVSPTTLRMIEDQLRRRPTPELWILLGDAIQLSDDGTFTLLDAERSYRE